MKVWVSGPSGNVPVVGVVPSPKLSEYVSDGLSESAPENVAVTGVGAVPEAGDTLSVAVGAASVPFATTVRLRCAEPPAPLETDTVVR